MQSVAEWGGNNAKAIFAIRTMRSTQKQDAAKCIGQLLAPSYAERSLRGLIRLPGIDLVMATKIYRFLRSTDRSSGRQALLVFFQFIAGLSCADCPKGLHSFPPRVVPQTSYHPFTLLGRGA